MEITAPDILRKTHYGLRIYSHVLQAYYPNEVVLKLSGKKCKPAKNPFNKNKRTLLLENKDWIFYYQDSELLSFTGDPFDFAVKHYNLTGQPLLQKINSELNLRINEPYSFYGKLFNSSIKKWVDFPSVSIPKFSYFRKPIANPIPNYTVDLLQVYQLIKGDQFRITTEKLRQQKEKDETRKYKAWNFDYVTFSGIFSKRNNESLVKHSNLLTIDFDNINDVPKLKEVLLKDPFFETELMFVSPSGNGLKWVISIDLKQVNHSEYFIAVSNYLNHIYNITVDGSGKDVSRACFLCHDPDAHINPNYLTKNEEKIRSYKVA